ncbi:MAG: quinolinate synthase NadA [Deltaproteobacteria bacterium]|nr:MAG: quinolinate synthase NadA [Deltaproteobacteria bacterium]
MDINGSEEYRQRLVEKVERLRRERNAVILAHNYQLGEVQDIADFCGDSLDLSRRAAATDADVIVFCGVHFMAETAAILSPRKTVLLPDQRAGCPMADMADAAAVREARRSHPNAVVVTYVNSTAEVKAESDICCTSANAARVVESIDPQRPILFLPDRYLGTFVAKKTGRNIIPWPGFCPTHRRIKPEHIERARAEHPNAKVVVHPECLEEVASVADEVLSTGQMIRFVREDDAREFIVGTELGILHRMRKENPDKVFIPATEQAICPNMKWTSLEGVAEALEKNRHVVKVPERIAEKARLALERMLEVS